MLTTPNIVLCRDPPICASYCIHSHMLFLHMQELVKELTLSKKKLHSTEEELKAVRGYLDNLLLRIMETNPGILGVGNL